MVVRRISRTVLNKRAVSNVVSAVILTGVVIALSLAVFGWAQSRSSDYHSEYSETIDAETAKLREKLAFEYVFYNEDPPAKLSIYLLNYGTIDDVRIKTVYLYGSNGALVFEPFMEPQLYLFQSWVEISELDRGEEGRLVLTLPEALSDGYYGVRIATTRGATFDSEFVV
ncbi:MAG: hypothetical protein JSV85_05320 [Candidatus Bathyarchaeota archaeon]|nr:MAG: hypothetical protein JSV85_05320 [Candidatus Bathyarchaeota archaeon]